MWGRVLGSLRGLWEKADADRTHAQGGHSESTYFALKSSWSSGPGPLDTVSSLQKLDGTGEGKECEPQRLAEVPAQHWQESSTSGALPEQDRKPEPRRPGDHGDKEAVTKAPALVCRLHSRPACLWHLKSRMEEEWTGPLDNWGKGKLIGQKFILWRNKGSDSNYTHCTQLEKLFLKVILQKCLFLVWLQRDFMIFSCKRNCKPLQCFQFCRTQQTGGDSPAVWIDSVHCASVIYSDGGEAHTSLAQQDTHFFFQRHWFTKVTQTTVDCTVLPSVLSISKPGCHPPWAKPSAKEWRWHQWRAEESEWQACSAPPERLLEESR